VTVYDVTVGGKFLLVTLPLSADVLKSFSNILTLYPLIVVPVGGDQLNVGLALVPDRVMLVIKEFARPTNDTS
jgi:hypothetical protein